MCIDKYIIQPNSPEHYDYFLGWFYRSSIDFKRKIWNKIQFGEEKIEFNEFYFLIDFNNILISIYSIYDTGTHNNFFTKDEWKLVVNFNEFETITGIKEIDYEKYYETKDNCELAILLLEDGFVYSLDNDAFLYIKHQLNSMYEYMDLNYFFPDYHLKYQLNKIYDNFLYELAISYINYAKPIDIIAKSNLCK